MGKEKTKTKPAGDLVDLPDGGVIIDRDHENATRRLYGLPEIEDDPPEGDAAA